MTETADDILAKVQQYLQPKDLAKLNPFAPPDLDAFCPCNYPNNLHAPSCLQASLDGLAVTSYKVGSDASVSPHGISSSSSIMPTKLKNQHEIVFVVDRSSRYFKAVMDAIDTREPFVYESRQWYITSHRVLSIASSYSECTAELIGQVAPKKRCFVTSRTDERDQAALWVWLEHAFTTGLPTLVPGSTYPVQVLTKRFRYDDCTTHWETEEVLK